MKSSLTLLVLVLLLVSILTGCAAGPNQFRGTATEHNVVAGFWLGLWQGFIAPFVFVVSLFRSNLNIYELHNNGAWYKPVSVRSGHAKPWSAGAAGRDSGLSLISQEKSSSRAGSVRSAGSGRMVNAASNGPRLPCLAERFPLTEVTLGPAGVSQPELAPQLAPLSGLAPESVSRS